jgi:hypothetical protein
MKVRIVSEGSAKKTRVFTESGEDITSKIKSISISIQPGRYVVAELEMFGVEVDVIADVDTDGFQHVAVNEESDTETLVNDEFVVVRRR